MKFKRLRVTLLSCVFIAINIVNVANASIIDNGDYTTVNGIDWLDMSFSVGISYNDVLALTVAGEALEGWSVASFDDVSNMYGAFGYTVMPNNTSGSTYDANLGWDVFQTLVGRTYGSETHGFTIGYVSNIGNGKEGQPTWQQAIHTGFNGYWRGDTYGEAPDDGQGWVGTYLMRVPAEVPEPSTLAILALGMIGLASHRFKKQS